MKTRYLRVIKWLLALIFMSTISPTLNAAALVNGGKVSGTLSSTGLDEYTFNGTSGQGIVLTAVQTSPNLIFRLRLSFGGTLIYDSGGSFAATAVQRDQILPDTGTYRVTIEPLSTAYSGSYNMYFAASGANEFGNLQDSSLFIESIDPGDIDSFTLPLQIGESAFFSVAALNSGDLFPRIMVLDPNGHLMGVSSNSFASAVKQLEVQSVSVPGNYTVLVWPGDGGNLPPFNQSGTGPYHLYSVKFPGANENGHLGNSENIDESIEVGDLDTWEFYADSNTTATITTLASGGLNTRVKVFDPSGQRHFQTASSNASNPKNITLSNFSIPGFYTLLIHDLDGRNTGSYNLQFNSNAVIPNDEDVEIPIPLWAILTLIPILSFIGARKIKNQGN